MEMKKEEEKMKQPMIKLANGVEIPQLGFGTFKVDDGQQVIDSVREALQVGYRHIDTAAVYGNESGVGQGMRESGVPREEIFLTSKVSVSYTHLTLPTILRV